MRIEIRYDDENKWFKTFLIEGKIEKQLFMFGWPVNPKEVKIIAHNTERICNHLLMDLSLLTEKDKKILHYKQELEQGENIVKNSAKNLQKLGVLEKEEDNNEEDNNEEDESDITFPQVRFMISG